ncbi:uncharacterized protein BJ171DRAFT_159040 [Polychytrium aggregatum]|uniref:uncharacterized protein n=1 Tax=Polychytrium aggregatum TaxID=110093 RepID=UPI0022FEE928|nr:uncharacterized protein BJ171DRAFT_159040 [Polychytrium aggregatum]KAI9203070.1 hypothetical protein BJ171DRAFT_159040 [Polychytrium aggregatum]
MLLMKSIRIYIIFGYKKLRAIKASDTKLILATLAVVVLEIALCAVWVLVERPMAETGGVLYATVCASSGSSVAVFESLLYIINGLVVLGCVGFAYLTRGAHERFKESKTIAVCSYAVAGAVILGLPLAYILAGNSDSSTMFFSGRLVIVCLILGASTLVPIALFSSRLVRAIRTDADDGPDSQVPTRKGSFQASSDTKGAAAADVTVYAYECGVQGLKFGGAWASSNVLVLSMLDLIEFREPGSSGAIQASFRLSECECQLQEPSTGADKESASSKTVLLRRNKKAIVIEFESSEAAEMFLDNHRDAKARPATFKTAGVGFLANNPKRDDGIFGMVGKANSITRSKSFNGSISSNHLDTQVVNSANNLSSTNNVNSANNLNTGFSLAGNQTLSVNAAAMPATPTRRHSAHGAIPKIMRTSEL